jgi:uncharacterized protein Yka (UPF0111/DUF47 family)
MKSRIVEHLGETDVLLPSLVAEGLAANDRVKVHLSALQAAASRARNQGTSAPDLTKECRAAGVAPAPVSRLVEGAKISADGRITAPHLAELGKGILAEIGAMLRAVEAGSLAEGKRAAERLARTKVQERLASLSDISEGDIAELTGVSEPDGDSLHRLIMDMHKALNRLAADNAEEIVADAHAFGLQADDRATVEAFMQGIGSTSHLKFDHPGLATTAVRSGSRLTIQNDIGVTDAHVVVIAIEGNAVTVTHTDVHRARAKFFTDMLNGFPVCWSGLGQKKAEGLDDGGTFYLVAGHYDPETSNQRNAFLATIGASLVFLIDWNKARKVLRAWVAKDQSIRILDWAASNRVGHRAFLELGGNELVTRSVRNAAPTRIGFGERLDAVLGREAAADFLKGVLRISTEALLQGRSVALARDRIEADLVRRLKRVDSALLAIVVRQAGLAREIATSIAHHVAGLFSGKHGDGPALATRARRIEEKADRVAREARSEIARLEAGPTIERLVNGIEDVIDELEQAAFIASLLPERTSKSVLEPLSELCAVVLTGTETAASGSHAAGEVPEGHRADSEDALAAVSRLMDVEHRADDAERNVTTQVLHGGLDLASSLAAFELARALGRSSAPPIGSQALGTCYARMCSRTWRREEGQCRDDRLDRWRPADRDSIHR